MSSTGKSRWDQITAASANRILMLDGAMGTMLQKQQLEEEDFRGERFKDWPSPLKGNNDLLVLTKPEAVRSVHDAFLAAGADLGYRDVTFDEVKDAYIEQITAIIDVVDAILIETGWAQLRFGRG